MRLKLRDASWDEGAMGILSRTHPLKHRGPVQGCVASSGLCSCSHGAPDRDACVGCGADGIQIEVREDGPVNQSVFDTLTKKSLGQRRETGTPGLRDQMVPKSSGEGLCSDSLADLGCSQLGDPAPRVSDRPPESLDGLEPYQASLYGLATNPAESYLAMVVVVMPRPVLQVFMLTQASTQSSPPNQGGQSSNPS